MMGVAPPLLDQGQGENGDSIDGSTISSSASATLAPFHQTHKNSRPRGRRAVGGKHGDDEHNSSRSRASFQNPLYKNVRGDDHHLSNDVSGARNGRGVRSSDRAPIRGNDVQGSIDGRTRLNAAAPMNVSGARNGRGVHSSDPAPVRGNGVQGSIDGRVRLDDTTPMNVSGVRNGRGVRSSDQAPVRGNGVQGSIDGRIRLGVTAPIKRSDEYRSADMSGMIVLQDPKRTRSSAWGSPSVRGGGGDRALPRVNHRHGDSFRSFGSGVLDVVDSGGRANSGGVYGGKEPSFRERGCLTTSTFLKLITILAALCSVGLVWLQYDFATGRLCPHGKKKPCLKDPVSQALLSIAKLCAGALFPSIAICVLSKCYATRYYVNNSWLALVVDFEPTHKLHTYYGVVILLCSVIHSAAHLARLAYESNLELLSIDAMNRSGIAALVLLLPTALPMMFRYIKAKARVWGMNASSVDELMETIFEQYEEYDGDTLERVWQSLFKLTYELRKLMHMAFIPFIIAVCFHGVALRMLGSILLTWYLADRFYFTTKMTFFIGQPSFKIVGRGTFVRFYLPQGYHFKPGAYIQVNCPAISAMEWHPFSLFPVPGLRPRAGFHVEAIGDWTEELFRLCLENPQMPLWITAAQPSVLERTAYYDNVILVCTGAGITPAVCVIERLAKKKNVHLLWLSREAGMVAMFEKQVRRVRSTVHLTGKPSGKTKQRIIDLLAPARSEVVATTTAATATNSCSSSPVPSSSFDADALEACTRRAVASLRDFPGALRDGDEGVDKKSENFWEESGSTEGASERSTGRHGRGSSLGEREGSQAPRGRQSNFGDGDGFEERRRGEHRRGRSQSKSKRRNDSGRGGRRSRSPSRDRARARSRSPSRGRARSRSRSRSRSPRRDRARSRSRSADRLRIGKDNGVKRSRDLRPVSVCFGRPDIERYITETVEGTAVTAEWADVEADAETVDMSPPASRLRQALVRLNTNQRISKKDLMSADLSVVKSKSTKPSSKGRYSEVGVSSSLASSSSEGHRDDRSTWLVIYCGANLGVEKSVASTCGNLKVAWRKEYFSAW